MFRGMKSHFVAMAATVVLTACEQQTAYDVDSAQLDTAGADVAEPAVLSPNDEDAIGTLECRTGIDGLALSCSPKDSDRDGDGIADAKDAFPDDPSNGGSVAGGPGDGGTGGGSGGSGDGSEGDGSEGGGSSGPTFVAASDQFTQVTEQIKPLDVVVVVDNSGSMAEEQANLGPKLTKLLDFADRSDWRIAVRTTDSRVAGIAHLSEKSDATRSFEQKKNELQNVIQGFGIAGSGREEGIPMAVEGLKAARPGSSDSWLRPDSLVAVLIVSDEDNCSNGLGCTPAERNEASFLLNHLNGPATNAQLERELGSTAKVYGLIRRSAEECTQAAFVGTKYMEAVQQSGGLAGRICDEDYTATLSAMSADIGTALQLNFELTHTPVPTSIQVLVDGSAFSGSFLINGKTIQLSPPPPSGSQIAISYQYQAP